MSLRWEGGYNLTWFLWNCCQDTVEKCQKSNNRRLSGEKRNWEISIFLHYAWGGEKLLWFFVFCMQLPLSLLLGQGPSPQRASRDAVLHFQWLLGVLSSCAGSGRGLWGWSSGPGGSRAGYIGGLPFLSWLCLWRMLLSFLPRQPQCREMLGGMWGHRAHLLPLVPLCLQDTSELWIHPQTSE